MRHGRAALAVHLLLTTSAVLASTRTVLLVTLTPSTGSAANSSSSFAELTAAVFGNATGSVTFTDNGSKLGSARLSAVNGSSGASAAFTVAVLPAGIHTLVASFGGSDGLQPSSSLPLTVAAGGAPWPKADTRVPAPLPQGAGSEDALGVRVHDAAAFAAAEYTNIVANEAFAKGSSGWALQGGSLVSASSSSGAAAVKLGQGSYVWQALWSGITPHSAYVVDARAWVEDGGSGLAGATFFDGVGGKLSSGAVRVSGTAAGSSVQAAFVAPPGAYFAAVWAGKWAGGGALQLARLAFGPQLSGVLSVDCSVRWRNLSSNAQGFNVNYLMDLTPEWRNGGGPTYLESMQAMGAGALRYPGGEEANTYQWAPPPFTKPQPVLTTTNGFPGGDFLFYNRRGGGFQYPVMDFDQLMGLAAALNVSQTYIVLNHDSVNVRGNLGDPAWGYDQLKAAAVAWVAYIARMGYDKRARHFEISNESWKTNQAAQYAWALLDWAPALKAANSDALIGANGPAGRTEIGDLDQGVSWWPQVLGAASGVVDFVATHPYPVNGFDYLDYVAGNAPNLQQGVIEADIAINTFAAPADRGRIRIAVTETGVVDWCNKWQNSKADLGHALVAFDAVANCLSHPRVDAVLFWTTRWRYGGFGQTNQAGSVADALQDDNSLTAIGKALALAGRFLRVGTLLEAGSSQAVRLWAVADNGGATITLIALNKALNATQQGVQLRGCSGATSARVAWQLSGTAYTDASPVLVNSSSSVVPIADGGMMMQLLLPPTSLTVLVLQ